MNRNTALEETFFTIAGVFTFLIGFGWFILIGNEKPFQVLGLSLGALAIIIAYRVGLSVLAKFDQESNENLFNIFEDNLRYKYPNTKIEVKKKGDLYSIRGVSKKGKIFVFFIMITYSPAFFETEIKRISKGIDKELS